MKATRSLLQVSLALALAGGLALQAAPVQAQQGPVLDLDYGGSTNCLFETNNGVNVSGATPGVITASGSFTTGCPTGGGATPPASVALTATPATIEIGQSANISWSGVGDICRYDGSSLPAPVAGWLNSGEACIGASQCALGNSITPTFTTGGTYQFSLSCTSGASGQQQETTAFKTATVQVTGGAPPTSCVAPPGLTRQTTGRIATHAGAHPHDNVDVTRWDRVLGWAFSGNEQHYGWPGLSSNGPKVYVNNHQYLAMEFTVPVNYPYFTGSGTPWGTISTADTDTTDATWSISITEACGDFTQPPLPNPEHYCYHEFTPVSGAIWFAVTPPGLPVGGGCNLERGKTYFLNVVTADMNNAASSNCPGSSANVCKFNLYNGGDTVGTYGPIP